MKYFFFFWKSIGLSILCVFGLFLMIGFLIPQSVFDQYETEKIMRIIVVDIFVFCFLGMWFGYLIKNTYKLIFFLVPINLFVIFFKLDFALAICCIVVSVVAIFSGFCLSK